MLDRRVYQEVGRKVTMNRPALVAAFLLCALVSGASASGQSVASLHTTDTSLRFQSTSSGPRLIDFKTKDAQLWSNRVTEVPLDSVEVDGKRLPVRWKFKPEASSSDAQKVAYVYESSSLKLRMTSEWIARADYGPVEHQIKIENLDSREVWIPFVDSIQLDLTIDPSVSLEHFYVDKGAG